MKTHFLAAILLTFPVISTAQVGASDENRHYQISTPVSEPASIRTGPDGALWLTETAGSRVERISTAGLITEYACAGHK